MEYKLICLILILVIVLLCFLNNKYLYNRLTLPNDLLKKIVKEHMKNNKLNSNDDKLYTFYAYFAREKTEQINIDGKPPYYNVNNIDFADLNGQIFFFRNEILKNQDINYDQCHKIDQGNRKNNLIDGDWCRKYGINTIDKWLIKYKPSYVLRFDSGNKNPLSSFASINEQQTDLDTANTLDRIQGFPGNIGIQDASLSQGKEFSGVWLSSIGECLNKKLNDKCKGKYYKNCMNSSENTFNEDCLKNRVKLQSHHRDKFNNKKLFDSISANNYMVSGVCDDNIKNPTGDIDCQIVSEYVGSIRLNDLGFSNNNKIDVLRPKNDSCTKHVHNILKTKNLLDTSSDAKIDKDLKFWEPANNFKTARELLNRDDIWCHQTGVNTFIPGQIDHKPPLHKPTKENVFIPIQEKSCDEILNNDKYKPCGVNNYLCFTGKTCGAQTTKEECERNSAYIWCGPSNEYNFKITM